MADVRPCLKESVHAHMTLPGAHEKKGHGHTIIITGAPLTAAFFSVLSFAFGYVAIDVFKLHGTLPVLAELAVLKQSSQQLHLQL